MFGRLLRTLLAVALSEVASVVISAGAGWVGRKLSQGDPATSAGTVVRTPQGAVVVDGDGNVVGHSADASPELAEGAVLNG